MGINIYNIYSLKKTESRNSFQRRINQILEKKYVQQDIKLGHRIFFPFIQAGNVALGGCWLVRAKAGSSG